MRAQDIVASTSQAPAKMASATVGENLRAIRQARGESLQAVAAACSVSAATLSRIENGLLSPTFDMMARIADGLGIEIAALVRNRGNAQVIGWITETRVGAGRQIETPRYRFEFLCDDVRAKSFLLLRAEILCRSMAEFGEMHSHSGHEQITVQTGRVEVRIEHYRPKLLNVGDSLAFDSRLEHAVIAPEGGASVLWVFAQQEAA